MTSVPMGAAFNKMFKFSQEFPLIAVQEGLKQLLVCEQQLLTVMLYLSQKNTSVGIGCGGCMGDGPLGYIYNTGRRVFVS